MVSGNPLYFYPLSSLSPTESAHSISLTWNAFVVLYLLIQVIELDSLSSSGNLLKQKQVLTVPGKLYGFGEVASSLWDCFLNWKTRGGIKCHWTACDSQGINTVEK